jgi:glycosyltransferase involved in cell wall biosynthesis
MQPVRIGFVLHVMQVAGAEMLVAETIRQLRSSLEPVVLCLDRVGQLGETLRGEGIEVIELNRRPGLDFRVAKRLAAEIGRRRLEVVHAHQYTPFFYTALARVLVRHPLRVIFTEHGRHYPDHVSVKRRLINRLFLNRMADEITGVCQFSADSLATQDGFPASRIRVNENGIRFDRYAMVPDRAALRTALGLAQDRRYIACIARFHPVKDHRMLVSAFADVAASRSDTDLLLAGDGPLRAELEQYVRSLGLESRVRFLGVRSDVPQLLGASDVFALSSVSEAASLTLLEAMASGLPVVVTDVGGNPEIVRDGVDGFLVPRGNAAVAATKLLTLVADPEAAAAMGREARTRVRDRFNLTRCIEQYYEHYERAASHLRGARVQHAAA